MATPVNPPTQTSHLLPPIESLKRLAVSESGFIFDPVSGHSFSVNETGLDVIHLLQTGKPLDDIIEQFQHSFATTGETIERDLIEFIALLREQLDVSA